MKSGLMLALASYLMAYRPKVSPPYVFGWYSAGLLYVASSDTLTTYEVKIMIRLLCALLVSYFKHAFVA